MNDPSVNFSLRISAALAQRLDEAAAAQKRNRNNLITVLLENALDVMAFYPASALGVPNPPGLEVPK